MIRLLERDGWERGGMRTHGIALRKQFGDRTRVTVVPNKSDPLPRGTLGDILGSHQTGLGRAGLADLIARHGL